MKKGPDNREPASRSMMTTGFLIAILLIAFALRFAFYYQMAKSPIADMVIEDSKVYNDWARRIAGGEWVGSEVFYALPLYPYFLGLIYTIFGYHLQLAKFIQVLLGTLNCFLLFRLGRRLFNPVVALLAAFFMAGYSWLVVYDSAILSPVLIIFLNLSVLLLLHYLKEKNKGWAAWLGGGLLVGLTTAASAHILLFAPLVIIWLLSSFPSVSWRKKSTAAATFLFGVIAVIGLITCRNWQVGRDFVPLTAHGGINFFIGNNPHSRGVFEPPPILRSGGATLRDDSVKLAQKALGRPLKPSEVSAYWFDQGRQFIKTRPGLYLRLLWKKFVIFWDGLEIADVIHPYFFESYAPVVKLPLFIFRVIAPLALLGIFLSWKLRKKLLLLYLFVSAYMLSTVLYFINSRYRLPLVPLLMLFGAYTVYWWWEKAREKKLHLILVSLIPLLLFVYFVNPGAWPYGKDHERFVLNMGAGYNHLGTFYSQKGDLDRALIEFRKALELEPYRAEAHYNLANMHLRLKKYHKALSGYREAIRINPFYESAHLALALTYEHLGEKGKARSKYLEIIQNLPRNLRAYLRLARLLNSEGKPGEAVDILKGAVRYMPENYLAHLYLGDFFYQQGRRDEALQEWKTARSIKPDDPEVAKRISGLSP